MAGPYGIPDYKLEYGGSDLTPHITKTFPSLEMENETEEHTPGGQSLVQHLFTGRVIYSGLTVSGPYTEALDAILGAAARGKTDAALVLTYGGSKKTTFSKVGVQNYKRPIEGSAVTSYEATFVILFGSTVTEA